MPCLGKGETEVESDIVSWCSRIQVCLFSKPVNTAKYTEGYVWEG